MTEAIVGLLVVMIVGETVSHNMVMRGPEVMFDGTEMRTATRDMLINIGTRQ